MGKVVEMKSRRKDFSENPLTLEQALKLLGLGKWPGHWELWKVKIFLDGLTSIIMREGEAWGPIQPGEYPAGTGSHIEIIISSLISERPEIRPQNDQSNCSPLGGVSGTSCTVAVLLSHLMNCSMNALTSRMSMKGIKAECKFDCFPDRAHVMQ